uniref:Protein Brevis radix-like 1 n=1 Tax=Nicotiana tabacum TaxID=4097 RepID=A0A1S4BFR6_TOBAC|nr:PREDICTED: protein Brevis radix-like 1 [Nicotiana tabacum]
MLTCITCKQKVEDDGGEEVPNTKDSVKSLTAQIKDIALKVSGAYRCKSSTPTSSYRKGHRPYPYPDFDAISEGACYHYQTGSSNSTPAWDFTSTGHLQTPARPDSRLTGGLGDDVVLEEEDAKEWTAHVEPGIQITFVSLPRGGNDLKRIRFSRDMFNKCQAQRWWGENFDRIMELYNVQRFNKQALSTTSQSEDGRDSNYSRLGSARESHQYNGGSNAYASSFPKGSEPSTSSTLLISHSDLEDLSTQHEASTRSKHKLMKFKVFLCREIQIIQGLVLQGKATNITADQMLMPLVSPRVASQRDSNYSRLGSARESHQYNGGSNAYASSFPKGSEMSSMEASRTTTSSRDEASISVSNASDMESEWIEQDEPGVYITIRQLADGTRELSRVRFRSEKFGEEDAKQWLEQNWERVRALYL